MSVNTTQGTRVFIGTTLEIGSGSPPAVYADDTYVEIGEVEDLGEFGDEANGVNFISLKDGRVRKFKGSKDAGTLALVVGRDPLDAGQVALKVAEGTKFAYNFKVIAADAKSEEYSDSVFYFSALVMSSRDQFGSNDQITKTMFNIGINSPIVEEPSSPSP